MWNTTNENSPPDVKMIYIRETANTDTTVLNLNTRTVPKEAIRVNKTWEQIKTDAKNRVRWRILVEALCSAAE
jgi:hypothetical protein